MNILVTGCAGYIGSVLCEYLTSDKNNVVYGIDTFNYKNQQAVAGLLGRPNFHVRQANACFFGHYRDWLKRADVLIPLAAYVGAPLCERASYTADIVNYRAVRDLAEAASIHQKIIFPNTNSGYGTTSGKKKVFEGDPLNPISVYGQTKCEAERAVLQHPNYTVFRLATVFGTSPRMRFDLMVNDFFRKLFYRRSLTIFEPEFMRNYVHVRDVVRAFSFAMEASLTGVYNLGHPKCNLSKLELAFDIADYLNLPRSCVAIGDGEDPDKRNYIVSNRKILATGFTFEYPLHKGYSELEKLCSLYTEKDTTTMSNV